jgi:hypothetical protein
MELNHDDLPSVANAQLPASYEHAKTALANCSSMDECKDWADKAKALASYARQSQDESLRKMAMRIQARAIRRAGELLKQIMPKKGANQNISAGAGTKDLTRTQAAEDAGFSHRQRNDALRVATLGEDEFTQQVESDNPPTVTKLAEQGTRKQLIDLKGRDPKEFNQALHFIALFERHLKAAKGQDTGRILGTLTSKERDSLRSLISQIDNIHDHIITRI